MHRIESWSRCGALCITGLVAAVTVTVAIAVILAAKCFIPLLECMKLAVDFVICAGKQFLCHLIANYFKVTGTLAFAINYAAMYFLSLIISKLRTRLWGDNGPRNPESIELPQAANSA